MADQELPEKVLTRQMGMIAPVVNSDGETDSDEDDDVGADNSFGKFSFH